MHKQGFNQGGVLSNKKTLIAIAIVAVIRILVMIIIKGCDTPRDKTSPLSSTTNDTGNNYSSNFPTSGEGHATLDKPIKAYLIPLKTHIKVLGAGHTKFVLVSNPNIFFICACKKYEGESGNIENWYHMPAGNYFIYPYQRDEVAVSWR